MILQDEQFCERLCDLIESANAVHNAIDKRKEAYPNDILERDIICLFLASMRVVIVGEDILDSLDPDATHLPY